ncbi:hypothetical protein PSHT_16006 [Puccinia striiformis]|uniref:diacylglycerol O-acyltransferase n=1 Tax=Puccinia striiformis TaxID=27350 RepID=A0A2S4UC20_9BASI|nr:hypothetical protein PSHT_16006 [Puccinia striiformis]
MFRLGGRRQLQIKLRRTLVRLDQVPRSSLDYGRSLLDDSHRNGSDWVSFPHIRMYTRKSQGEESKPSTSLPSPREIHRELDNYVIAQAEAKKILSVAVFNHYIRIKALEKVEENRKRESSKKESESKLNPTQSQTPTSRSNFPPNMADDPEQNSSIGLSRPSSTTGIAHNLIMSKAVEASLRLEREELETRIRQISSRQFKKKRPSKPDLNSPDDYLQLLPFTPSYSSSISSESPIDEPTDLHKPTIPASVPEGKTHHQELNRENPTQFSNNDDHQEFQNIECESDKTKTEVIDGILNKSNILLLGPTGSGKSLLARTLARQLDVPYIESSATTFTQAGYVGEDVESCVIRLYQESNNDASRASRGIIFIDEIDKIARKSGDGYVKDVSGEGVQQAMLRLLEGTLVTVSDKGGPTPPSPNPIDPIRNHLDPSHSNNSKNSHLPIQVDTLICGLQPEENDYFPTLSTSPEEEPKIPILATLSNLTETDLHRILIEPKNSLLHQYINLFKSFNVKIHFSTKAQKAIASLAYRKNTGARGLRQILEKVLLESMYTAPQSSIRYILIDEPVILANSPAKFYSRGEEGLMDHDILLEDHASASSCDSDSGSGLPTNFSPSSTSTLREKLPHHTAMKECSISEEEEKKKKGNGSRAIWVPIRVPPHRRYQTAAVLLWTSQLSLSISLFFFLMSYPITWPILIPYTIWILVVDPAPEKGGRLVQSVRTWKFWTLFASYFPVSLVKTVDLPSDRKYVFGYHPHGIIGMGAVANFGTEATGFSEKFPGLNPHLLTLSTNFIIPFYRDLILSLGICSVSIKSCISILKSKNSRSSDLKNNKGEGNCLVIVVGGAAESLSAHPGNADLTLKRRLGFIKLAIREGADLVPVFSFGENDIYAQLSNSEGTALYTLQKRFQAVFGFTLPVFHGRGIFNYSLGLLPYRHPIVSVVGKPIRVIQNKNPTLEEIEKVQKEYINELTAVWDKYKDLYARNRKSELTLIA